MSTERSRALRNLATRQGGYFTSRQAEALGYVSNHHAWHVAQGSWVREMRGIFRLPDLTYSNPAIDELHMWLLWTIGRRGTEPRGAIAYETALSVYDLSDLLISRVHLSVPKTFRVSVLPKGVVLHREDRDPNELTSRDGLRIVKPVYALMDLLREGRQSLEHIQKGLFDGVQSGVVVRTDLTQLAKLHPEARQLNAWLLEAS